MGKWGQNNHLKTFAGATALLFLLNACSFSLRSISSLSSGASKSTPNNSPSSSGLSYNPSGTPIVSDPFPTDLTVQISAGAQHTCALETDGTVWCWGDDTYGQLGDNSSGTKNSPVKVHGIGNSGYLQNISSISAGANDTCAVTNTNLLYCWGSNGHGELGNSPITSPNVGYPVQVMDSTGLSPLMGVATVSVGNNHVCAKTMSGDLCWGLNDPSGELGTGNIADSTLPVSVLNSMGNASIGAFLIQAFFTTSCALDTSGKQLYCWGANSYGLGDGSNSAELPNSIMMSNVVDFTGGQYHHCGLTYDGSIAGVECWGEGGLTGDGTMISRSTPVAVLTPDGSLPLTDLLIQSPSHSLAAGQSHTCAISGGSNVYCWGDNSSGQLGIDTLGAQSLPVTVLDPLSGNFGPVKDISAGGNHTCALKVTGNVYCWGDNSSGQLGSAASANATFSGLPVEVQ